jgi:hypothetical protein
MLKPLSVWRLVAIALATPLIALPAAIEINGTCELGNCASPDSLVGNAGNGVYPQDLTGSFSYPVAVGSDNFVVTGSYDTGYTASSGTFVNVFPAITYVGTGPSTSLDKITFDIFQNFFDSTPGTWDGTYTETVPLTVGANSTASAQLLWDGQSVGLVGPYGPGTYNASQSANLTGLDGNTLSADYQFVFTFDPGTPAGWAITRSEGYRQRRSRGLQMPSGRCLSPSRWCR